MKNIFCAVVFLSLVSVVGCRTGKDANSADSEIKSSAQMANFKDLKNGLYEVTCTFGGRTEISTVSLMNKEMVCDKTATNYIKRAEGQGGVFKLTCANGNSRVATVAQINSGKMCGRSIFLCSCSLVDLNSIVGFSKSVTNVEVQSDSKEKASSEFRQTGCFDAVSRENPAFSRQGSAARNVSCVDSPD